MRSDPTLPELDTPSSRVVVTGHGIGCIGMYDIKEISAYRLQIYPKTRIEIESSRNVSGCEIYWSCLLTV